MEGWVGTQGWSGSSIVNGRGEEAGRAGSLVTECLCSPAEAAFLSLSKVVPPVPTGHVPVPFRGGAKRSCSSFYRHKLDVVHITSAHVPFTQPGSHLAAREAGKCSPIEFLIGPLLCLMDCNHFLVGLTTSSSLLCFFFSLHPGCCYLNANRIQALAQQLPRAPGPSWTPKVLTLDLALWPPIQPLSCAVCPPATPV